MYIIFNICPTELLRWALCESDAATPLWRRWQYFHSHVNSIPDTIEEIGPTHRAVFYLVVDIHICEIEVAMIPLKKMIFYFKLYSWNCTNYFSRDIFKNVRYKNAPITNASSQLINRLIKQPEGKQNAPSLKNWIW